MQQVIPCLPFDGQAEEAAQFIDRLWAAIGGHGSERQCGWIQDRWGLSWQIIPKRLLQLLNDSDTARSRRVMETMLKMRKLEIAELERAAGT